MEFLGNWKFWVAVMVVTVAVHYAISFIMPKMKAGGSS